MPNPSLQELNKRLEALELTHKTWNTSKKMKEYMEKNNVDQETAFYKVDLEKKRLQYEIIKLKDLRKKYYGK